jgi:hypothetical protein
MGNCFSGDFAYRVLRGSIPGSLIPLDNEFDEFFQLCKNEIHTITSTITINPAQAFYVVVSGEVQVHLALYQRNQTNTNSNAVGNIFAQFQQTNPNMTPVNHNNNAGQATTPNSPNGPVGGAAGAGASSSSGNNNNKDSKLIGELANTFYPGETICFFRSDTINNGYLFSDDVKLSLTFKSKDTFAQVIGADYHAIDRFIDNHPHLASFKTLWELNWTEFLPLPAFESLTIQQVSSHSLPSTPSHRTNYSLVLVIRP